MFRDSELRRQLEATERELANQKWVLERFLESPAWRMTYPIRWVARQARKVFASPPGRGGRDSQQTDAAGESGKADQALKPSPAASIEASPDWARASRPRPLPGGEGM